MLFDRLPPGREVELRDLSPHARFEIPSVHEGRRYSLFLHSMIEKMLTEADERNKYVRVGLDEESGMEGGIGTLYIKGEFIMGCKLFWYEGIRAPSGWNKSVLFRDHEDKGNYATHQIILLADALAEFLIKHQMPFEMKVRNRSSREEYRRAKFPN